MSNRLGSITIVSRSIEEVGITFAVEERVDSTLSAAAD